MLKCNANKFTTHRSSTCTLQCQNEREFDKVMINIQNIQNIQSFIV